MKILFMSSSFNGGGITSFGHEVANAYSKGHEFSIIIGNDNKVPINNKRVKKYYYDCNNLCINNARRVINLINNEIHPDVIIGSNAKILSVIAKYLHQNIRIITVSHSLKYIEADVASVAHRYYDYIIAGSEYNKEYMAKKFGIKNKDKIKVIYNFVKEYPNREETLHNKIQSDTTLIVFVGGCAPSKTPELVVQVIRKLVKTDLNFKFLWVGNNNIHISRHFPILHIRDVRDLVPKDPRVFFTGRLSTREDAETILATANIFFAPSRREGCPMSFLEAIRVGVISIVADYPNFNREIVEKGGFGFVCPHKDVDAFVDKITEVCKNPESFVKMYKKAYDTYINELEFDTWKEKMDTLIFSNVQRHVPRSPRISTLGLFLNATRLRILGVESKVKLTLFEDLKVLYRMWRLKTKEQLN